MALITINGIDDLRARTGDVLGTSAWWKVMQDDIDAFAEATGDRYWIHTEPERAKDTSFGSTIAHGLYTLSLGPRFSYEIYEIADAGVMVNYGYRKVRFPAPLPVDSRVRMHARLLAVDAGGGGVTCTILQTFEREGSEKPVCTAEAMIKVFPAAS